MHSRTSNVSRMLSTGHQPTLVSFTVWVQLRPVPVAGANRWLLFLLFLINKICCLPGGARKPGAKVTTAASSPSKKAATLYERRGGAPAISATVVSLFLLCNIGT